MYAIRSYYAAEPAVLRELDFLGVDHHEFDLRRLHAEQQARDHDVDADSYNFV